MKMMQVIPARCISSVEGLRFSDSVLYWEQKGRLILMWTNIILLALTALEVFFFVWNVKDRTTHQKWKSAARFGVAAVIAVLMLFGVLEGFSRYAGIIILLAVMGCIGILSLRRKGEHEAKPVGQILRAAGSGLLYTAAMFLAILFPQFKAIVPTGSYEVTTSLYTWTDESRVETYADTGEKRRVTVQFYYPEQAGSYPLAVFSHGAASMIESNASTCRELASHGYVVAAVAHPYQAIFVKDADGVTTPIDSQFMQESMSGPLLLSREELLVKYQEWLRVRTDDMNFVLDTILRKSAEGEEGAFEYIDAEHIGLFGHSMGGAACEAVGRQRTDIDAVVVLEGIMIGELTGCDGEGFTYGAEPYPVPLLDVNSDSVASRGVEELFGSREYVNFALVKNSGANAREVTFRDAAHMNFCDLPLLSPPLAGMMGDGKRDARTCITTMNDLVLMYFDCYLKDSGRLDIADVY